MGSRRGDTKGKKFSRKDEGGFEREQRKKRKPVSWFPVNLIILSIGIRGVSPLPPVEASLRGTLKKGKDRVERASCIIDEVAMLIWKKGTRRDRTALSSSCGFPWLGRREDGHRYRVVEKAGVHQENRRSGHLAQGGDDTPSLNHPSRTLRV